MMLLHCGDDFWRTFAAVTLEFWHLAPAHYERAEQIIASYGFHKGIRTLDALQLSVAGALPKSLLDHFVASDRALCEVAALERLSVINPEVS